MKSRQQIEDTIQRVVCELLPKMPPQDIRPAYQEEDNAGKTIFGQNEEAQTVGFTPQDNFIYITAKIGTDTALTSINNNGVISTGYAVNTTFTFYGSQSPQLSLCLFSLLEIEHALNTFEMLGMYLQSKDNEIAQMFEIINEQWFERHEFSVVFLVSESIRSPFIDETASSNSVKISATVVDIDKTISSDILEV